MSAMRSAASLNQQGIGSFIDGHAAAGGDQRILAAAEDQVRQVRRLGVVDLYIPRMQRLLLLPFEPFVERGLLPGGQFLGRRDDDYVAVAAHVQALRRQNDVEDLIPRHIAQLQRNVALYRIADDDVHAAGLGQQLQHGARCDVLEIQRQPFAGVARFVRGRANGIRRHRWRRFVLDFGGYRRGAFRRRLGFGGVPGRLGQGYIRPTRPDPRHRHACKPRCPAPVRLNRFHFR